MNMGQPRHIARHAQTGKEVRGYVSWAVCVVGGQLVITRTDKEGTFVSSAISRIERNAAGEVTVVHTRNSVYHIRPVAAARP